MKLYVLDEPFVPADASAAPAPGQRPHRARWFQLGLAALALGAIAAYLAGVMPLAIDDAASAPIRTSAPAVQAAPADVVALPEAAPAHERLAAVAGPEQVSAPPAEPSSVVRRNGKFVIELHAVEPGTALAMLSKATGMTVLGADALLQHPAPVSASLIAPSPVAAWQSVFGDVANFAVSCAGAKACVVHFVAAAAPGASQATISPPPMNSDFGAAPAAAPPLPGTTTYPEEN